MAYQRGVFWGVVPYAPAAPFSVKLVQRYEDVDTGRELHRKFQEYGGALPFSVEAKLRPVLALSEPSAELGELTALRLANITRRVRNRHLTQEEANAVAAGAHPFLFPMPQSAVASLSTTGDRYAAIVDNPGTVHRSAILTNAIGEVSEADFAEISARLIKRLGLPVAEASAPEPDEGGDELAPAPGADG